MLHRSLRFATFRQKNVRLVWNAAEKQKQDAQEATSSFMFEDLKVELVPESHRKPKPDPAKLVFGQTFSDHMLRVDWTEAKGWTAPKISGLQNISLHPAAKVFHYAQELFEGMKAYRGHDDKVRLFRPDMNVRRLLNSAARLGLPVFQGQEFLSCLLKLVSIEKEWVPKYPMSSLYVRPTLMGVEPTLGVSRSNEVILFVITGPVGPYYSTGIKPVSLLADPKYVRAWPGGTGDKKLGCNYAPTLMVQAEAEKQNLQQVLWLFGEEEQVTEVGAMNVFILLKNKSGETELVTPPLSGIILPGVTRQSVLDLTREWNEFKVSERKITMAEVRDALKEKRLLEIFGSGTACVICPVGRIVHRGEDLHIPTMEQENAVTTRILKAITDIQYGVVPHSWAVEVD
uniref:Branched-chain-amino-acid aminotransferase n=2 Tax=Ornithodoros turicata TaxID=34597 RepID=A0A2R5L7H6_9ACAR